MSCHIQGTDKYALSLQSYILDIEFVLNVHNGLFGMLN